jgi:acyl-CoA hydrolase
MFTNGLMRLHDAGKITNKKGIFDGVSVVTFALGSAELYRWLDDNSEAAFLPVQVVNEPSIIARNRKLVTINGALTVDLYGQIVADTIGGEQISGVGGQEDFLAGTDLNSDAYSLVCLRSTVTVDGELRSTIVPYLPEGSVVSTPRHHTNVVVTEHGSAMVKGMTVRERACALVEVAHPDFRDELREATANFGKR